MFEEKIAMLNKENEEKTASGAVQFDKRTYTVDEIQDILGIGKNAAYSLTKQNFFRCVKIGGSIRISKRSFDDWLDQQV